MDLVRELSLKQRIETTANLREMTRIIGIKMSTNRERGCRGIYRVHLGGWLNAGGSITKKMKKDDMGCSQEISGVNINSLGAYMGVITLVWVAKGAKYTFHSVTW